MLLTSPSGTAKPDSRMAIYPHLLVTGTPGTRDWTYLTNAFWGEDAYGTWTVTMRNLPWIYANEMADQVIWNSFGITANFGRLTAAGISRALDLRSLVRPGCHRHL